MQLMHVRVIKPNINATHAYSKVANLSKSQRRPRNRQPLEQTNKGGSCIAFRESRFNRNLVMLSYPSVQSRITQVSSLPQTGPAKPSPGCSPVYLSTNRRQ